MFNLSKYNYKPIDNVREQLLGSTVTDIESLGRVIYLKDSEGRPFVIDTTGTDGAVVHAGLTDSEEYEYLKDVVAALIIKLNLNEDELIDIINEV